ncbi:hypothetical protein Y032_0177g608 [Ancylostoma ceylanicum]|uniref:Uncharacterized protein n=1 Tax=Ancylostoma ceylanicum TaxID=53326 RepID=A0A016SUB6_9BILA|nr:hypothetical protein Y032_0177g608 [Ancylostoma ceylanicum]
MHPSRHLGLSVLVPVFRSLFSDDFSPPFEGCASPSTRYLNTSNDQHISLSVITHIHHSRFLPSPAQISKPFTISSKSFRNSIASYSV